MESEELVNELIAIIPELEKDGFTEDQICEYCICFIEFNRKH